VQVEVLAVGGEFTLNFDWSFEGIAKLKSGGSGLVELCS
jgi:hypothetical protein